MAIPLILTVVVCLLAASAAMATTFYVDSASGSDANAGASEALAWATLAKVNAMTFQPGDRILLKSGGSWRGQLWPKGSGEAGQPIIVDRYGDGPKPAINGGGAVFEAVRLYNQHDWEISNLDVTNLSPEGPAPRAGVRVLGENVGALDHVHLRGLEVHDVNGANKEGRDGGKCNAGILFDVIGSSVRTHFNDVLIEGCHVRRCDRTGIKTWTDWGRSGDAEWQPYTKLVIRNNVVDDIGGDGIVACMADAPLIEHNVASRCNARSGTYNVAIWVWETDDALIQFNEAYLTKTTLDGQGFDIDGRTRRTIVQYNYSHENEGGFILLCEEGDGNPRHFNDGAIVRYNISQNDGARIFQIGGKVTNAHIYNNTIYVGAGKGHPLMVLHNPAGPLWRRTWPARIQYQNNIFYDLGEGGFDLGGSAESTVFDHSVFFGTHARGEPADPHKLITDPRLVDPGSGGAGRDTVDGYKLQPDSPCVDSGMPMPRSGGRDYWGTPVPSGRGTDRGAHEQ
jgi:hypothetical protein